MTASTATRRTRALSAVLATATLSVVGLTTLSASPASAGDDEVIRRGGCTGAPVWKLKAKGDDGRIEVEGEVDSNVNGQTWRWRILHDGRVSARGTKQTSGPSGSFEVERRVVNAPGSDRIAWRARNLANGQVCRGGLTF